MIERSFGDNGLYAVINHADINIQNITSLYVCRCVFYVIVCE